MQGASRCRDRWGGRSSERGRATGTTRSWFGSRQRAAEGWAPCSGDDPGVHRSAALRRGSRCSRELLPSPGGRTRPHCATCAARVCPGTTAAPWAPSPGSQGWRPENAFPRLTCHHGQRHQREALERDGAGVRKKPAPRADAGGGRGRTPAPGSAGDVVLGAAGHCHHGRGSLGGSHRSQGSRVPVPVPLRLLRRPISCVKPLYDETPQPTRAAVRPRILMSFCPRAVRFLPFAPPRPQ